jgi:hypothetical protein
LSILDPSQFHNVYSLIKSIGVGELGLRKALGNCLLVILALQLRDKPDEMNDQDKNSWLWQDSIDAFILDSAADKNQREHCDNY